MYGSGKSVLHGYCGRRPRSRGWIEIGELRHRRRAWDRQPVNRKPWPASASSGTRGEAQESVERGEKQWLILREIKEPCWKSRSRFRVRRPWSARPNGGFLLRRQRRRG